MASLLDALTSAANPLTAAATGNQQGIAAGNEINTGNMMDVVKLYQQKAAADLARQKAQSEMGLQDAQTKEYQAKTRAAGGAADQETYLHGPEFQTDYQQAVGGDPAATAKIAGRLAGHQSAGAILGTITPKAQAPAGPKLTSPDWVTNDNKPVVSTPNGFTDLDGKPLTQQQVKRYVTPPAAAPDEMKEVADGKGGAKYVWANPRTHAVADATVAPVPKVGQSALANRQKDYVSLMNDALPDLTNLGPKVNGSEVDALIKAPMAANYFVSPEGRQYTKSARDFLAGVLHEESGARLSEQQIAWGVPRYIVIGGDDPATIAKKIASAKQVAAARATNANYVPPGAPLSDEAKQTFGAPAGAGGMGGGSGQRVPTFEEWQAAKGKP